MTGTIIEVKTWEQFESKLDEITGSSQHNEFLFRGQATDWPMIPSLTREISTSTEEVAVHMESNTHHFFMGNAHEYLPANQYGYLRDANHPLLWWTVMQHYGCPTRLIDWTGSPYTALYFACESHLEDDGYVFAFNSTRYFDANKESHRQNPSNYTVEGFDYFDAFYEGLKTQPPPAEPLSAQGEAGLTQVPTSVPDVLSTAVARFSDKRIIAQQGAFTITNRVLANHCDAIVSQLGKEAYIFRIDAALKPRLIPRLRVMNTQGLSLFPDLQGLSQYAREKVRFPNLSRNQMG